VAESRVGDFVVPGVLQPLLSLLYLQAKFATTLSHSCIAYLVSPYPKLPHLYSSNLLSFWQSTGYAAIRHSGALAELQHTVGGGGREEGGGEEWGSGGRGGGV